MNQSSQYPRAELEAKFRRPTTLDLPTAEQEADPFRMRVEWDHPVHVEEFLEVTLQLGGEEICSVARVARVDNLVWKDPVRYEVFLDLFQVGGDERAAIAERFVEEPAGAAPGPSAATAAPSRYVMSGRTGVGTSFKRPDRGDYS